MDILPAIDLRNGQCVRLAQGDFAQTKVYNDDPLHQARHFAKAGAEWLHIVDLDGARDGHSRQLAVIERVAQNVPLKLQVGGGLRDESIIEALLDRGIERVVLGSLAVQEPARIKHWLRRFGAARIVAAFDVRLDDSGTPHVLTHAWQRQCTSSLWGLLEAYVADGLKTILCTDVARDGMLAGPNLSLYSAIRAHQPSLNILASGGVRNIGDVTALAGLGLGGAIVGKAIYEGHLDLAAAISQVRHAG